MWRRGAIFYNRCEGGCVISMVQERLKIKRLKIYVGYTFVRVSPLAEGLRFSGFWLLC